MKNKNIKSKLQKCDRRLFLHSRFSKIFRTPPPHPVAPPPHKGKTSIKPTKSFFNNNSSQRHIQKVGKSPPPIKQSTRNLSLGYTEIEKRRRAPGQDLFCVICNWAV